MQKHQKRMTGLTNLLLLAGVSLAILIPYGSLRIPKSQGSLKIYTPFTFVEPLDPREVYSVGNQMLIDHMFASHLRSSMKEGEKPVFSNVSFDEAHGTVTIEPTREILNADGKQFTTQDVRRQMEAVFRGSTHNPYKSLFLGANCVDGKVVLKFKSIPSNLRYLFQMPDFTVYDPELLPAKAGDTKLYTGPYILESLSPEKAVLFNNPHYPKDLRANQVQRIEFRAYDSGRMDKFLKDIVSEQKTDLAYIFGHSIGTSELESLTNSQYRVEIFPTEWLVYLGFYPTVSLDDRAALGQHLDQNRDELIVTSPQGQKAFSLAPSDRPFGLSETEYKESSTTPSNSKPTLSRSLVLGTLDSWYEAPLFKATVKLLTQHFPKLQIRLFKRSEMNDLYGGKADIYLSPLGISKSDPLNHLAFLMDGDPIFSQVMSKEELSDLALIKDAAVFAAQIKAVEKRIAKLKVLLPIGHFPGIVLSRKNLLRDEALSGNWGIQTWAYRID